MKVLQHPPALEDWFVKTRCNGWGHSDSGCGSKLKVYRADLRYEPPSETKEIGAVTYKCLCCGRLNDIGMDFWPEDYKSLKPYKRKWKSDENSDS